MGVKEAFDKGAKEYDGARKQLVPCFDDFYGTVLELIDLARRETGKEKIRILDLGTGTGLLAYLIYQNYPQAEYVLYDLSEEMLREAQSRFAHFDVSVEYIRGNYSAEPIEGEFDLVVSSLSIHHLTDGEKQALFVKIFQCLKRGGMFINADQALGQTDLIEEAYKAKWLRAVKEKGVSEKSLNAALERMKEDKMATLENQLAWLGDASFRDVNCWFQNYSFVVYSGRKA